MFSFFHRKLHCYVGFSFTLFCKLTIIPYNEQNSNLVKKRFQGLWSRDNIKAGILFGLQTITKKIPRPLVMRWYETWHLIWPWNHNQKDSNASSPEFQKSFWFEMGLSFLCLSLGTITEKDSKASPNDFQEAFDLRCASLSYAWVTHLKCTSNFPTIFYGPHFATRIDGALVISTPKHQGWFVMTENECNFASWHSFQSFIVYKLELTISCNLLIHKLSVNLRFLTWEIHSFAIGGGCNQLVFQLVSSPHPCP